MYHIKLYLIFHSRSMPTFRGTMELHKIIQQPTGSWRALEAGSDWSWTMNASHSPLYPSLSTSSSSFHPQWGCQQMIPAKSLPGRSVWCLSFFLSLWLFARVPFHFDGNIGCKCLIEDKQHSSVHGQTLPPKSSGWVLQREHYPVFYLLKACIHTTLNAHPCKDRLY